MRTNFPFFWLLRDKIYFKGELNMYTDNMYMYIKIINKNSIVEKSVSLIFWFLKVLRCSE